MGKLFTHDLHVQDTRDTQKVLREIIEHIRSMQLDLEKEYDRRERKERKNDGRI